jgi:hypothetical protein
LDPDEDRVRERLRVISGLTLLILVVIVVLAGTFGSANGYQADDFIVGTLLGALLIILGFQVGRLFWKE